VEWHSLCSIGRQGGPLDGSPSREVRGSGCQRGILGERLCAAHQRSEADVAKTRSAIQPGPWIPNHQNRPRRTLFLASPSPPPLPSIATSSAAPPSNIRRPSPNSLIDHFSDSCFSYASSSNPLPDRRPRKPGATLRLLPTVRFRPILFAIHSTTLTFTRPPPKSACCSPVAARFRHPSTRARSSSQVPGVWCCID
jgi:hypothetical protein